MRADPFPVEVARGRARPRAWQATKRWLILVHRWVGVVLALFFAMWFASGVVMIYVPYPRLTEAERLAGLVPLDAPAVRVSPADALARSGADGWPRRLTLGMLEDRPVYRILPAGGPWRAVYADDGSVHAGLEADAARRIAARFAGRPAGGAVQALEADQWTVTNGFIRAHRPLLRVALGDARGTELYVSQRTGEVIRDTTRRERFLNWLGSVPHWIYPTVLRERPDLWRDVVIWLSAAGIVGAVTGTMVGIVRVRTRGYRSGRASPYRGWMLWHHLVGLGAAVCVLTWMVSGFLSMNPGRVFTPGAPDTEALARYRGTVPAATLAALPPSPPVAHAARELELTAVAGRPVWIARGPGRPPAVLDAAAVAPRWQEAVEEAHLRNAARALLPDAPVASIERLEHPDAYYYGRHEPRPLPVLRVRFGDPVATWFHLDASTGELLGSMDGSRRAYRWLFNALHSLDVAPLFDRRPLWDAVVILLSGLGFAASATGAVIGWRRLRRAVRRRVRFI
jgi:hypothetical protein